jgi:hypothetical protein
MPDWPNVRCSENFNEESHGHVRVIAKIKLVNAEIKHISDGYLEYLDRGYRPGDLHKLDEAHPERYEDDDDDWHRHDHHKRRRESLLSDVFGFD